jgi:hypothetical protein
MRWTFTLLLAMAAALPAAMGAQTAADPLPERVVDRTYDAINRCDVAAFNSLFAPVVYGSAMEDSTVAPRRRTAQDISGWCKPPKVRFKMIHRIVLGPYVVDEQAVVEQGKAHLDIFEVRKGKIVHEWESDLFPPGVSTRP